MHVMMNLEPSVGADVYASRVGRTLNSGFVALMISVGHRTRLFDTMATLPPSTSVQIAGAARLTERYVREWLASMTAARVIHYDFRTNTYYLPIEYAVVLTRAAAADNLAPVSADALAPGRCGGSRRGRVPGWWWRCSGCI